MDENIINEKGGFRFAKGVAQYSAGVCALPGFKIHRVRFAKPLPLMDGFARIEALLASKGRPNHALCAMELRSPQPFDEAGFFDFNRLYIAQLNKLGIAQGDLNPIARTNVAPRIAPPDEVVIWAFSYTVPEEGGATPDFIIAGSGEAPEGRGNYQDHIIRPGDTSPDGLRAKADWVLGEMERRMASFDLGWAQSTSTQLYTVYDIHALLEDVLGARGAITTGLVWHLSVPPVASLDYEMDVRGIQNEIVI